MELIVRPPRNYHVSYDTSEELEAAILRDMRVAAATANPLIADGFSFATRLLPRAGLDAGRFLGARGRAQSPDRERDYFAVMMELDAARVAPWFSRSARKSVYMFDAWPARHAAILKFVADWGVQFAFVSSRQAAERLAKLSEHCTFIWVPEGVDPDRYQRRSSLERDIDVLQLGRKFDAHHVLIEPALERAGKTYVYEREKGKIIFPEREQFIDGLARSRISICVPSSVTHPERAGDIETMTIRYLQSMASKCLVLGHAPEEMVDLFGYNPVIEIDNANAAGQILDLLDNYDSYQPLIEKNHAAVTSEHSWDNRWARIGALLLA